MENPVVIVTGASRGLGAAAARSAAQFGASVVLAARSGEALEDLAGEIRAAGGQAWAVAADVTQEEGCQAVVAAAVERSGRIDALVNNAGAIEPIGPVAEARAGGWEANWKTNVLAAVMLTRLALPQLRERQGRVVNLTSGSAEASIAGWGAYSSAKAAVNQLTRVLAAEEPDITALALRPGIVDTEMQAIIRAKGKGRMAERNYGYLSGLHAQGKLLPPERPGLALAALALYAPHEWNGEVLDWNEERVQELVREHTEWE
jgi:NAD(P)-dependent dehydrogenase (short-subunit alcohol dehydrogenase family)